MRPNQPLRCEVRGELLVISIGVKTLTWSAHHENGGPEELETTDRGGQKCRVNDKKSKEWAEDVAFEMTREDETGASMLTDFIDKAMVEAADNGSQALIFNKTK